MTAPGCEVVECKEGGCRRSKNAQFGLTGPSRWQIGPMADGRPQFRALGPLEVRVADRVVDLGPAKQRAVLAVLLARAPDAVPVERLVDEVWPGGGPREPLRSLQVYLSALRQALGPEGGRLVTVGRAYRLDVPEDGFDVDRFTALAADCLRRHRAGDHESAVVAADQGLALWRGEAWQGMRDIPGLEPDAARLDELRLDVRANAGRGPARTGPPPRPGARARGARDPAPAPRGPPRPPDAGAAQVGTPGRGAGGVRRGPTPPRGGDRSGSRRGPAVTARGDPR